MSKKTLSDIATRHQIFLEGVKSQQAQNFASVLPKLEKAIVEVVNELKVDTLSQLNRKQLKKLLVDLQQAQGVLIKQAEEKLMKDLGKQAKYEAGFEERALEAILGAADVQQKVKGVSAEKAFTTAKTQPLSAAGELLEPFTRGWGERHIKAVDQEVMRAWGEGRTIGELVRSIRGTKALAFKDGLVAISRRQAEAVARTAVQHVAQQARMATWEENSDLVIGYTFVATLDGRTTSQCRSLDGMTFELGKGPVPPVHVNCRSTTIPKLPKKFDFLDEGATRSSMNGYVDAGQTYYDWLKDQPTAFQDEVLGPSRAKIFREGGLTSDQFAKLNLGKNFQPLTLQEMMLKEPQVFEKTGVEPRAPEPDEEEDEDINDEEAEYLAAMEKLADEEKKREEAERKLKEFEEEMAKRAAEELAKQTAKLEADRKRLEEELKAAKAKAEEEKKKAEAQKAAELQKLKEQFAKDMAESLEKERKEAEEVARRQAEAASRTERRHREIGRKEYHPTFKYQEGLATIDEIVALNHYKGNGYRDMNKVLRFDSFPEEGGTWTKIGHIDNVIQKSEIKEDIYAYRVFKPPAGFNFEEMSDFTFQDKGFVSVSTDPEIAKGFTQAHPEDPTKTASAMFRVKVPAGSKGAALETLVGNTIYSGEYEAEIVLPRGTKFRFTGVKTQTTYGGRTLTQYEVEIETD